MLKPLMHAFAGICGALFMTLAPESAAGASLQDRVSEEYCDPALADMPDRDRVPLERHQEAYPNKCSASARPSETVALRFDVRPDGVTDRIEAIYSTNRCFSRSAVRSVARWKYSCVPEGLKGVETTITYQLEGEGVGYHNEYDANCTIFGLSKHDWKSVSADASLGVSCKSNAVYPVECKQPSDSVVMVVLRFDVSPDGDVQNIETLKAKKECFADRAAKSLERREYAATKAGYQNIGAIFTYRKKKVLNGPDCLPVDISEASSMTYPNLKVSCRGVFRYPEKCIGKAESVETVTFLHDVSPGGAVQNIRLKETTNECFENEAWTSVIRSRYEPSDSGGKDLETTITFRLEQ